jgi:hypothetical protein
MNDVVTVTTFYLDDDAMRGLDSGDGAWAMSRTIVYCSY